MLRTARQKSVQMWVDKGYLQSVIQGVSEISFIDHLSLIFFTWDRKAQYIEEVQNMNHVATNPGRNYLIGLTGIDTNLIRLYSVQLLSCIQLLATPWTAAVLYYVKVYSSGICSSLYFFSKQLLTLTKCQELSWASASQTIFKKTKLGKKKKQIGIGCFHFQTAQSDIFVKYSEMNY